MKKKHLIIDFGYFKLSEECPKQVQKSITYSCPFVIVTPLIDIHCQIRLQHNTQSIERLNFI